MEFLLSLSYIRFEIFFLVGNLVLLALFLLVEIWLAIKAFFAFLFPKGRKTNIETVEEKPKQESEVALVDEAAGVEETEEEEEKEVGLSPEKRHELAEIIKNVRTRLARAEFSEARARIIEGLAIDKWNKELNYMLASIYERDKDYKKAEFIYKDLVLVHDTDPEIYMKLGFALSIQGKYEIAFEIYKRILTITDIHTEALEMLTNLSYELKRYEDAVTYARQFLRMHPHSGDILSILASSLIALGKREEALEAIAKLKNLDPYNPRIREMKEKIELEIELAKQFEPPGESL